MSRSVALLGKMGTALNSIVGGEIGPPKPNTPRKERLRESAHRFGH
ncbi:MAG TPA: hypothetical protein VEH27_14475 [Methylomirabilota bacterium]|nr:hypothetical protein [Methylomirabilota bacterium]